MISSRSSAFATATPSDCHDKNCGFVQNIWQYSSFATRSLELFLGTLRTSSWKNPKTTSIGMMLKLDEMMPSFRRPSNGSRRIGPNLMCWTKRGNLNSRSYSSLIFIAQNSQSRLLKHHLKGPPKAPKHSIRVHG